MKILVVAPYIYYEKSKMFQKNNSGLGVSIESSSFEIGRKHEVVVLVNSFLKKNTKIETFIVEKHTFLNFLLNIKVKYLIRAISMLFKRKTSLKMKIHLFYQVLNQGYIERQIKKQSPDIVQIHMVCPNSLYTCQYCEKRSIPFVMTIHGIISNPSIVCPPFLKEQEQTISSFISESKFGFLTCVSSGTRNEIIKRYNVNPNKIFVTLNGIKDNLINEKKESYDEITIPDSRFVIISSGNVSENKNQIQLLNALCLLPIETQNRIVVLLAGTILDRRITDNIEKYKNFDLRILGFVERKKLLSIYEKCNLNVLLSISEGFGLSIAECYLFGVPSLFFADIDSYEDFFENDCCIAVEERKDTSVRDCLLEAMKRKWDKQKITNFGKKFLLSNTALSYIDIYQKLLDISKEL